MAAAGNETLGQLPSQSLALAVAKNHEPRTCVWLAILHFRAFLATGSANDSDKFSVNLQDSGDRINELPYFSRN